jgi:hypothetical protein
MSTFFENNKLTLVIGGILIVGLGVIALKKSGEPALEDRVVMDRNAKRTSDSLKRALDSCLMDPIKEAASGVAPVVGAPATSTAAPANGGH